MARSERETDLVEPEGVNAGGPVDAGPGPTGGDPVATAAAAERRGGDGPPPDGGPDGQGGGEMLSRPRSHHGVTEGGPGQELSAGEG